MRESSHPARPLDLDQLRAAYPAYEFSDDRRRDPVRYSAVARDLTASPHSVITTDLDELGRELAAERQDPATASGAAPAIRNRADDLVSELEAAWPGWQVWYVPRVYGGTVWCARRRDWQPGQVVLNAGSPEDLTGYLEDETRCRLGMLNGLAQS